MSHVFVFLTIFKTLKAKSKLQEMTSKVITLYHLVFVINPFVSPPMPCCPNTTALIIQTNGSY